MRSITTILRYFSFTAIIFLVTVTRSFSQGNFSIVLQQEMDPLFQNDYDVGLATISYMPGPQDMFLSIGAQQESGPLDIIVSNLFLPGNMYGTGQRTVSMEFNLNNLFLPGQTSIPENTLIITYFHIFQQPSCYPFEPSTYVHNAIVPLIYFDTYAVGVESPLFPQDFQLVVPTEPPCIPLVEMEDKIVRTDMPNLDLDDGTHGDNAMFAGDLNACVPTATANSMKWLEMHNDSVKLGGKTLREVMEELSGLMKRANNEGTYSDSMIVGKMDFIEAHNLPIEVKYQSFFLPKDTTLKSTSGNSTARNFNSDTGNVPPDFNFIKQMMKDGEDAEMNFTWYSSANDKWYGHSVVLTGYQEFANGTKVLTFNHDKDQRNAGGTVTQTDTVWVDSTGWMRFGPNKKYFIKDIVAESPIPTFGQSTAAWLNEFFTLDGTLNKGNAIKNGSSEFIEMVANQNIPDPQNYRITLYDKATGTQYSVMTLDQFTAGATMDSFIVYTISFTGDVLHDTEGGIALSYNGSPIPGLFISYGGVFTALDGDWTGLTSTDAGITPAPGNSIALTGTGAQFSSFSWTSSSPPSPGSFNQSQEIPVELVSFSAYAEKEGVSLKWMTATEINNSGFEIERAVENGINEKWKFEKIGFVDGAGTTTERKEYSYFDVSALLTKLKYRLKQIDLDGSFEYSGVIEINLEPKLRYELAQNYPNPFNPVTVISYTIPDAGKVQLTIYNILGQTVAVLVNESQEKGIHKVEFDGTNLNSGIYFYQLAAGNNISTRKMMLIK